MYFICTAIDWNGQVTTFLCFNELQRPGLISDKAECSIVRVMLWFFTSKHQNKHPSFLLTYIVAYLFSWKWQCRDPEKLRRNSSVSKSDVEGKEGGNVWVLTSQWKCCPFIAMFSLSATFLSYRAQSTSSSCPHFVQLHCCDANAGNRGRRQRRRRRRREGDRSW